MGVYVEGEGLDVSLCRISRQSKGRTWRKKSMGTVPGEGRERYPSTAPPSGPSKALLPRAPLPGGAVEVVVVVVGGA